jgi:hypothetical protein
MPSSAAPRFPGTRTEDRVPRSWTGEVLYSTLPLAKENPLASSKRDTDSLRGGASQTDTSLRRGGPQTGTAGRGGPRELDFEASRAGSTTSRTRLASAAHDPGEWSSPSDTLADVHAGEDEFADEDTFTDRDTGSGEVASRDTMQEITGRDTLLDLTATALALSGDPTFEDTSTDVFAGDRTLDDDSFPDEDTFDEPTRGSR